MANTNNKFPAFQFYPKDWLSSEAVICMTAEQRGWYIQLLCHSWLAEPSASLPNDDRKLKALAGAGDNWAADKQAVLDCFEAEGDRLVNRKLAEQHRERVDFIKERAESGRRGAAGRWRRKDGSANDSAMQEPMAPAVAPDGPPYSLLQPSNGKGKGNGETEESTGLEQGQTLLELLRQDEHPAWLEELLAQSETVRRKVVCVADWVGTKSTVWKGKPCLGLGGYRAMEKSYDSFYAKAAKKPHDLPAHPAPQADNNSAAAPGSLTELVEGEGYCQCAEPLLDEPGDDACIRCFRRVRPKSKAYQIED